MKRLITFALFVTSMLLIPVGFKTLSCGFKLAKMHLDTPFRSDWEVANEFTREQLQVVLSQPFRYLNRGAQCYVFASQDDQYVIKFFRFDRTKKVDALFSACRLAYNKAREETGVLYLHLNQTQKQFSPIHMKGPLGQNITLSLDSYRFVIQKKASSFQESILAASPEIRIKRLDAFLELLHLRLDKGIRNSDPSVVRNFGFLNDKAIEIDFGNYSEKPTSREKELTQYVNRLRAWLKENAPECVAYFDEKVNSASCH